MSKKKYISTKKLFLGGFIFILFILTLFISRTNLPFASVEFSDLGNL